MSALGIVVIGRNEGERLIRCLQSIGTDHHVVYVDSGSTDNSVAAAQAAGARVVTLDMTTPFTAARARNAGRAALGDRAGFIQFVDGDCSLQPGWLDIALATLTADSGLAAVTGRRREVAPGASRYNWLCDVEWNGAAGPVRYIGGDAMVRTAALDAAGGYPDEMIAGEEPDLSIRLRATGWRLQRLSDEMTLHDAAMTRFSQWWRRAERSGHAYAELAGRHRGSALHDYDRRLRAVLFWGMALPLAGITAVVLGAILSLPLAIFGGVLLALAPLQLARLAYREWRAGRSLKHAATIAVFLMMAKPAQAIGAARYWRARASGRRTRLIEYKKRSA